MHRADSGGFSSPSMTRILLNPDPTEGGGGGGNNPPPKQEADPNAAFEAAVKKVGDVSSLARQAYTDAERLRAENEQLRAKLPAAGSVVLAAEDADAFGKFKGLGAYDDVQKSLDDGKAAVAWRQERERSELEAKAARLHGFKPEVLSGLPGVKALDIRFAEVERAGKKVEVARVVTVGADGKEAAVDLDKHAESAWKDFLPALRPQSPPPTPPGPQARPPARPDADTDRASAARRSLVR